MLRKPTKAVYLHSGRRNYFMPWDFLVYYASGILNFGNEQCDPSEKYGLAT